MNTRSREEVLLSEWERTVKRLKRAFKYSSNTSNPEYDDSSPITVIPFLHVVRRVLKKQRIKKGGDYFGYV